MGIPQRRSTRNVSRVNLAEPPLDDIDEDDSASSQSDASAGGSDADEDMSGREAADAGRSDDDNDFEDKPGR